MTKQYSSFSEIDERLKILSLQRDIYKESLKLSLNRAKVNLYPTHFMGGLSGILQKVLISFVAKKLLKRFRNPKQKNLSE